MSFHLKVLSLLHLLLTLKDLSVVMHPFDLTISTY